MSTGATLDALDRRIVGALQVDGRASWRQIAAALGEPERTVGRHGSALLETGAIAVVATGPRGEGVTLRLRCVPGMSRLVGASLARRSDSTSCYLLTGEVDCFAELFYPRRGLARLTIDEVSSIPGVVGSEIAPVTRYYRGAHEWRPGLVTEEEVVALTTRPPAPGETGNAHLPMLHRQDQVIIDALAKDGRMTHDALGRLAGISEATARRRVETLRRSGRALIRAVVEPSLIGLHVEAMVWIQARPRSVDDVGSALAQASHVLYAAATMGRYQLVAHVVVADMTTLHEIITRSAWSGLARSAETSLIVAAPKRSGWAAEPQE